MNNWDQNAGAGMCQQPNEAQQGLYYGQQGMNEMQNLYNGQQGMYEMERMYNRQQGNNSIPPTERYRLLNPSMILGILSSILLLIGLLVPMIDFSHFEENVDIQYNLIKICKNVGLISAPWTGIPYGIVIGIIAMFVLSFVRIPLLKLVPSMIVMAMFIIMLVDMGNVIDWVETVLNKYYEENLIIVNVSEVMKSLMAGVYILASGWIVGLISCFIKIKDVQ